MFHFKYIMADSSESNPVVMEDTWKIPLSTYIAPEDTWKIPVSRDIGPDNWMDAKLTRQLQEHYSLKQAINIFPMPHHPSYNSIIALQDLSSMLTGLQLILHPSHWLKLDFSMTVS
jgi:hypothetical protein